MKNLGCNNNPHLAHRSKMILDLNLNIEFIVMPVIFFLTISNLTIRLKHGDYKYTK